MSIAKERGFGSIEDYVRANLHYLPMEKQELFRHITGYQLLDPVKEQGEKYSGVNYHGKD